MACTHTRARAGGSRFQEFWIASRICFLGIFDFSEDYSSYYTLYTEYQISRICSQCMSDFFILCASKAPRTTITNHLSI